MLIFGLVIFLNIDNFINSTVISMFRAVKNQGMDLVPALLADVYYTMYTCHDKKKGLMHSYILLYQCLASHLYDITYMIKTMNNHDWSQKLVPLTENPILWYSTKLDVKEIIFSF